MMKVVSGRHLRSALRKENANLAMHVNVIVGILGMTAAL